jgi:hypothetical protein
MRNTFNLILLVVILQACLSKSADNPQSVLPGNWFLLYPDDDLQTREQEAVYAATQDSLTDAKCLKLLRFSEKGSFNQQDSIGITGNWKVKEGDVVQVFGGGEGFDRFQASFTGYEKDILKLTEMAEVRGQKLKLVWHLLRIDKGKETALFDKEKNNWRIKAVKEETDDEIRERVKQMLNYYAVYFDLIADRSTYFMPSRVILPIKFYQHGIGLKTFDPESKFARLFYSTEQARFAYYVLEGAIDKAKFDFKDNSSFSREYAQMLEEMAKLVGS